MRPFAYERAADAPAAVRAGAEGATFLGGGTNLVDLMKLGVATPERLVDVTHLPLGEVRALDDGGVHIGATVRNADAAAHPLVRERAPLVAQALLAGASGQLRNVATMGGNLLQRTRCPYFQDVTKPCNKRSPGSGCPAIEGEHRNLAILGHSAHCVATHPSDLAVALAAHKASVRVAGPDGETAYGGLHRLPGDEPQRDTNLGPGELITGIDVPAVRGRARYRKVRDRASFAFAVVSVAAVLDLDGDTVRGVRLAFGGVAHAPWRAGRAEELLLGNRATEAAFAEALDAELAEARPLRDNAFKVPLLRRVATRVLLELAQ